MTTAQINKKYQDSGYTLVFKSNGIESETRLESWTFGKVKKEAIERLSNILERHYGRGDHTVTVYGLVWQDTRTAPILVKDTEVLFTL